MANIKEALKAAKEKGHVKPLLQRTPMVKSRGDENSPTTSFTEEGVEISALQSVQRLVHLWDSQRDEREKELKSPDDYVSKVNGIFKTYQSLRVRIDSALAYTIGDTLNSCRARYFEEGLAANGKKWSEFLVEEINFSPRLAYDFMNIAARLSAFREKKLNMEQLRSLLSVQSSGAELAPLAPQVEELSPRDIMAFKKETPKPEKSSSLRFMLGNFNALLTKAEQAAKSIESTAAARGKMTAKEKEQLFAVKERVGALMASFEKSLSSS